MNSGTELILNTLSDLHKRAKVGALTIQERIDYDRYKRLLANYQPRCIAHVIRKTQSDYEANYVKLQKKEAITIGQDKPILYPLHHESLGGNGIAVFGSYLNPNPTTEDRVMVFIEDIRYLNSTWKIMYDPRKTKPTLVTLEYDAELHGDSALVFNTFFSAAKKYHDNYRDKIEASPSSNNRITRP